MTDYSELVKALRGRAQRENEWYEHGGDIINDAADAIEALQAEIRESMQRCAECGDELAHQMPKRGEIVRCGECKHHEDEEPGMVYCPKIVGSWVSENWYCADGEREVQE